MNPRRFRLVCSAAVALLVLASPRAFVQEISATYGLDASVANRLAPLDEAANAAIQAGRLDEAVGPLRRRAEIVAEAVGADDWRTGDLRRQADEIEELAGRPKDVRDRYIRALGQDDEVDKLFKRGEFDAAIKLQKEVLATYREIFGENGVRVARASLDLGLCWGESGDHRRAEPFIRSALESLSRILGEHHPDVALGYATLATTLESLHEPEKTEDAARKAAAMSARAFGERHDITITSQIRLRDSLNNQGKLLEAEDVARAVLEAVGQRYGEESEEATNALVALSQIIRAAGRAVEAEIPLRRALATSIRTRGVDDPDTAWTYNSLALTLLAQGRRAEAEELLRQAFEIRLRTQGEDHPDTISTRGNLASTLDELGLHSKAEPLHRAVLECRLKMFGRDHEATALTYNNLGLCLLDQAKLDEAESALVEQLEILKRIPPANNPALARAYLNLMRVHQRRHQWDAAVRLAREAARMRATTLGEAHPVTARTYDTLATILAQSGSHEEALAVWEKAAAVDNASRALGAKGLRGVFNPARSPSGASAAALARAGRPVDAWVRWEASLARGLLAEAAGRAARPLSPEEQREEASLADLARTNEEEIGALAASPAPSSANAKRLEALRLEKDDLVRRSLELEQRLADRHGAPAGQSVSLEAARASLAEGEVFVGWADFEPYHYACLLRREGDPEWLPLNGSGPGGAWTPEDLDAVPRLRRALVTREASTGEVEAAIAAVAKQRIEPLLPRLEGVRRLVMVNSWYLVGIPMEPLLAAARPNGEEIAVSYAPSASMFAYLKARPSRAGDAPSLLAVGDPAYPLPASANLAANEPKRDVDAEDRDREANRVLRAGPAPPARLPGSRREVEAIARLFPPDRTMTMLGEEARASALQELARSGQLKGYRFLHFACHGRSDPDRAFASALLLAPDPDRSGETVGHGASVVTAEWIARGWDLDADLVVLSACESALGLDVSGEGQLGFAQPLFVKGARSLVLSLWKVDDDATALLMARFYRNLLGDPTAQRAPLPKAEALAEAKTWLRQADGEEIGRAVADVAVPSRGPIVALDVVSAADAPGRYADPRFWAGFILIGSPD